MLIITRKIGQSFMIGSDIEIHILDVQGVVKIGIAAPKHVPVLRKELVLEAGTANKEAALNISNVSLAELGEILKKN